MLRSSLCDYSDAYIHAKRTMTLVGQGTTQSKIHAYKNNTKVKFKNCTPFIECISKINNTEIDHAKDLDVVMSMYDLIEYSNNYS